MNIIYFQEHLLPPELKIIKKEFPQFHVLSGHNDLSKQEWKRIEIFYGKELSSKELSMAPQLHWIHSSTPFLQYFCTQEITSHLNTILTFSPFEYIPQVKEYLQASVLAFAKQLFSHTNQENSSIKMPWSIRDKIFLEVGLSPLGQELARGAKELGFQVWGVTLHKTIYDCCDKVFSFSQLHELLPLVDVTCLSFSHFMKSPVSFSKKEFDNMKSDSILAILGSRKTIDEDALFESAEGGKFRGIIVDAFDLSPIPKESPLITLDNTLITNNLSTQPMRKKHLAFRIFLRNLRQFVKGNYSSMQNIVNEFGVV